MFISMAILVITAPTGNNTEVQQQQWEINCGTFLQKNIIGREHIAAMSNNMADFHIADVMSK